MREARAAFEVTSAFEPVARLERRSPTLDGAVPLRVAQACVPLLEGNAVGFQVVLAKRLVARSRLGKKAIEAPEASDRALRAAVPLLAARGLLEAPWRERLAKSWWWTERGVLRVWTGLLVRPRRGVWLRVSATKNRAVFGLRIGETFLGDDVATDDGFTPLVLDLESFPDGTRLEGEVATVIPVSPGVSFARADDDESRDLARAHAAFYGARYFATKKGEVTRKYRRVVTRASVDTEATSLRATVAHLAGPPPEIVRVDRVLGPRTTVPRGAEGPLLEAVRFVHAVPLRAQYDGNTLDVAPDRTVLADGGRVIRAELSRLAGPDWIGAHEGAVLYLTKYVTPHPHGEPHFFVKPWSFVRTPEGFSSLVEGVSGEGYELLRGVVWTDRFHATPAVFQLTSTKPIRIRTGAPMLEVIPLPRALAEEIFTARTET